MEAPDSGADGMGLKKTGRCANSGTWRKKNELHTLKEANGVGWNIVGSNLILGGR